MTSFNEFGLAEPILRALAQEEYVTPTPIQIQTIPLACQSRDVIGIAQTGTGKTAAFALPILNHLFNKRQRPAQKSCRVLVLSPTRELSGQIADSFRAYGRHIRPLEIALAIGGVPINPQVRGLARGAEVLVATPGRLLDLVHQRALRLDQIEVLVLDEADRMLDMGFIHDIKKIVSMLPKQRQTLFFSATMPQEITRLADAMLREPARVAVTPQATTVDRVEQRVILTEKASKASLLIEVLKPKSRSGVHRTSIAPTRQKAGHTAERSGGKSQNSAARSRRLRNGGLRTLITFHAIAALTSAASATVSYDPLRHRAPAPRAWRSRSATMRGHRRHQALIRMTIPVRLPAHRPAAAAIRPQPTSSMAATVTTAVTVVRIRQQHYRPHNGGRPPRPARANGHPPGMLRQGSQTARGTFLKLRAGHRQAGVGRLMKEELLSLTVPSPRFFRTASGWLDQ